MTASPVAIREESLESLKARLDEPRVAAALSHLLDHADLLAVLLVGLDGLVSRTETIGDSLSDSVGELRELAASFPRPDGVSGSDMMAALATLSAVLPKVAGPLARVADSGVLDRVVESGLLDSLAKHADLLEILLVGLDGFVRRGDTISDALADGVGEIRGLTGEFRGLAASFPRPEGVSGGEVVAGLVSMSAAVPKLAGPIVRVADSGVLDRVVDSGLLDSLVAHADLLEVLLVGVDGFVKRGETISDALADGVGEIRGLTASLPKPPAINGAEVMANLVALSAVLPAMTGLLTRVLDSRLLDRVLDSGMIESLLDSGMLNPQTMDQLAMVGRALADASADPGRPEDVPGLRGMLKLRKDPQIGRGLAFSISMLRALGSQLEAAEEPDR